MAHTPSLDPRLYAVAESDVDQRFMDQMRRQDLNPVPTDNSLPRFTLVVGPSPFTMPRGWEYYLTTPYEGVSYISTVVHNAGHPVRIVDVRYAKDPMAEAWEQVRDNTDVLAIATFEDNFPWEKEFIDLVKQARPDLPVICGGSLVTSVPQVFLDHTRMDIGVISEGEITILELMESFSAQRWEHDLPNIHGICWRGPGGESRFNAPRGQMPHLNSLPRMRLELWPQASSPKGLQPQIIASYSRGCKCDCSFCFRTTPRVSAKSPEKLDEELTWYKERYGVNFIFFSDLTFTAEKKQTLEMCEVIGRHNLRWTCMTRCADVDKERLDAMKAAGCDIILFGVESLGARALKEARKNIRGGGHKRH